MAFGGPVGVDCLGLIQQLLGFFFNQRTGLDRLANAIQYLGWQVFLIADLLALDFLRQF